VVGLPDVSLRTPANTSPVDRSHCPGTAEFLLVTWMLRLFDLYSVYVRPLRPTFRQAKIAELFAIHGPVMPDFGPSWNVAPQTFQPVVHLNRDTGDRKLVLMRWGLIPFLGEGHFYWAPHDQCKSRDDHHSTSIQRGHQIPALPSACGCIL
jgi:hypothetical protein